MADPEGKPRETVLLVDDEDTVRELVVSVLEAKGYRVLAARSGQEALAAAERHEGPIHLLLADVGLPSMDGPALRERLARARPEMRVLFMSGFEGGSLEGEERFPRGTPFVMKPFTPSDLAREVRAALGSP